MEHTDFHKIFQTLLPIAIFIMWALFSKSGKKRAKAAPAPRHEHSDHGQSEKRMHGESENVEPRKPEGSPVNWKQSIDEMLGEFGLPVEHEQPPPEPKEPSPSPQQPMAENNARSIEDLQPVATQEPSTDGAMKSHLAIQASAYDLAISPIDNQKAYSTAIENIPTSESATSFDTTKSGRSVVELQKYIIWSEILSRPMALRD